MREWRQELRVGKVQWSSLVELKLNEHSGVVLTERSLKI